MFVVLAGKHWTFYCEMLAVTCPLWLCSWMCFTRKWSSWETALVLRDRGWKQTFLLCFCDLAIITFLTLLCTPRCPLLSPLGGSLWCPPGRHCFATCSSSELPSLITWGSRCCSLHCCPGCHCLLDQSFQLPVEHFGHSLILPISLVSFSLSLPAFLDCGVVKQHCFSYGR